MTEENSGTGLEIAVIGMSARFPAARTIHEFWDNLKNGVEPVSFFSDQEMEAGGIAPALVENSSYVKAKAIIKDIEYFDSWFFGYTPQEAEIMDPQVRIFHECAWEALENAGYASESFAGLIGLFAGASSNFYWEALTAFSTAARDIDYWAAVQLTNKDFLSLRVAYKLGLKGPAIELNTACSTSLVAIHMACQALLNGECDMALAGGVTVTLPHRAGYIHREGMVLSPDGHCRAFDNRAAGIVTGEGAGIVVLKPLEDARSHGDYIYAVIKGSAVNNDGIRRVGFSAPSIEGQAEVILTAHQVAHVEPGTIGFIETHGTATGLGDPVEIEALKLAFDTTEKGFCALGSVKANIGHLDAAAGAAGFIKTVLALTHRQIPPSLHFETPNHRIDFDNTPFYVNTLLKDWESSGTPLRAGVSSFGIGGTNAHVILEEAPGISGSVGQWVSESVRETPEGTRGLAPLPGEEAPVIGHSSSVIGETGRIRDYQLILLSAKTPSALDRMTENLVNFLKENHGNPGNPINPGQNPTLSLADVAYTLQVGRKPFPYRRRLVCPGVSEAITGFSTLDSRKVQTFQAKDEKKQVIFMFPGLGSQYVNMGRRLYEKEPLFREEMDRCFRILNTLTADNIKEILYPGKMDNRSDRSNTSYKSYKSHIDRAEIAQLVVFIFEYSLARLLMAWGINPKAMIGYSFGEYTAACLAGVFSLEDALKVLAARGTLIRELPPGRMISVPLPGEELEQLLTDQLSIAIDNGVSCVVSGAEQAVRTFETRMKEKRLVCVPMDSSHAIHSIMMEPVLKAFAGKIGEIQLNPPQIPYISCVTGTWITVEDATSPHYWARQLRETVRFARGIKTVIEESKAVFLEVGAGRDIRTLVQRHLDEKYSVPQHHQVVDLVRPRTAKTAVPDDYYLLDKIGLLWLYGIPVDWEQFHHGHNRCRVPLPGYPFEGYRHWKLMDDYQAGKLTGFPGWQGVGKSRDLADWFYVPSWKRQGILHLPDAGQNKDTGEDVDICWLVFTDELGVGDRLLERLEKDKTGRPRQGEIITVKAGLKYKQQTRGSYEIHPGHAEDYESLVLHLDSLGVIPHRIVHLWGLTGHQQDSIDAQVIEKSLESGFYSLLYLAKALGRHGKYKGKIEINVITDNMQEVTGDENLHPGKAPVLGPCCVIPQEYPGFTCKSIDIADWQNQAVIEQLLIEMGWYAEPGARGDTVVAFRGEQRWVQFFEPVRLAEPASPLPPLLRPGGVYLIIGGLGDIGYTLAEYLIKTAGAKVILTGCTPLPPPEMWAQYLIISDEDDNTYQNIKKLQQLKEIEGNGDLLYCCADVSDAAAMHSAVKQGEDLFGPLDGVIHSAGIIKGESFNTTADITVSQCRQQFRAKLQGLLVLEELLTVKTLDFCLMISSISTILGGLGFVAYSAANHFMNAFSIKHNQKKQEPWIIVDWDGTNKEDTKKAFHRILSTGWLQQVIFSVGGKLEGRISRWVKLEDMVKEDNSKPGDSAPLFSRPEISNPYEAPRSALEKRLAEIWQRFFGIEKIGIDDDLFDLGGDSLKAINIISIIQKELKVAIPIKYFFDHSTIAGTAKYIADAEKGEFISIKPLEEKEYYILSSAQKRLYILQELDKDSIAYNSPQVVHLEGLIDKEQLRQAVAKMIHRHESLRTSIHMKGAQPLQKVHRNADIRLPFQVSAAGGEIHTAPAGEKPGTNAGVEKIIREFIRPFDLAQTPCFRLKLLDIGENHYILMFDIHHIVTDGISHEIFIKELMTLYTGKELPELPIRYKDYSQWQNSPQHQARLAQQEAYWMARFQTGTDIPVLVLPYDYPRPVPRGFAGDIAAFQLSREETRALRKIAAKQGVTLYMLIMTAFNILLFKLSQQEDIVVGTPVSGRRHAELESIIGVFINTLPVRSCPSADKTLESFLQQVKETTLQAFDHQDYPFEDLVDKLAVPRDTSRSPLFDALFVSQVSQARTTGTGITGIQFPGLKLKPRAHRTNTTKFDLTLDMTESTDQVFMHFEYCSQLFKRETIQRFIKYFQRIATAAADNLQQHISDIDILSPEEKQQLLTGINQTGAEYPQDKTLRQLFTGQVEKTPDHIALEGPAGIGIKYRTYMTYRTYVSYRELNEKSNRLASLLQERGVQPDTIVGIMAERSLETVIGILSILKAGSAYLPIDPDYPRERVEFMLKDCSVGILLTTPKHQVKAEVEKNFKPPLQLPLQFVNIETGPATAPGPSLSTSTLTSTCQVSPANLAYVIYTSGTTGKPKGTLIQHDNLVQLLASEPSRFDFNSRDVWTLFHSFCFDFSVWEMYGALLFGGKLILVDRNTTRDPSAFLKQLKREQVTVLNQTPLAFYHLMHQELKTAGKELNLRYIIFGGEALQPARLKEWQAKYPGTPIINMFGITETTVHVTFKEINRYDIETNVSNIGTPLPSLRVYVLDKEMKLVPGGVPGECCVGGAGVGRGYLNQPQFTAEKFIINPYKPGEILYRSGDLVRLNPAGEMEYLGRIDKQVKIRGFRIELGEIEIQLLKHHAVKESVVMEHNNETGEKHLYAFIVPRNHEPASPAGPANLDAAGLRDHLAQRLPGYMVPSYFFQVERIPLTANGKVHRQALLDAAVLPAQPGNRYVPLENTVERQIAAVWQEVLKCERIGRNDNFFDLGGNSLNVILVIGKLKEGFKMEIPVVSMFEYPTVGAFSQYLLQQKGVGKIPVRQQPETAVTGMRDLGAAALSDAKIRRQKQQAGRGIKDANS
jgi:iturin family lipopeptide synthetase A